MYPTSSHFTNPYTSPQPQYPVLPPQQILTAKGKASIDTLHLSPNSSVLIADETAPIIWRCTSDGLGNVTAEAWDITPHKDEAQKEQENLLLLVQNIDNRLKRLEENYEQSITERTSTKQYSSKPRGNQANVGNAQKPRESSGNDNTVNTE